jgi:hypothetical protein
MSDAFLEASTPKKYIKILTADTDPSTDIPLGSILWDAQADKYYRWTGSTWSETKNPSWADAIPDAEALTIVSGVIVPTLTNGPIVNVLLTGGGGITDALTQITADSTFKGKRIEIRNGNTDPATAPITITDGTPLLLATAGSFILNHEDDMIELEWKSTNVWRELWRLSAG